MGLLQKETAEEGLIARFDQIRGDLIPFTRRSDTVYHRSSDSLGGRRVSPKEKPDQKSSGHIEIRLLLLGKTARKVQAGAH